jgi:Inner membrane component domain
MRLLLNIIWFVLAGLWIAIGYTFAAPISAVATLHNRLSQDAPPRQMTIHAYRRLRDIVGDLV